MTLPKKTRLRDGHPVQAYVDNDDHQLLVDNEVNIAKLIRDTIADAARQIRDGAKPSFPPTGPVRDLVWTWSEVVDPNAPHPQARKETVLRRKHGAGRK